MTSLISNSEFESCWVACNMAQIPLSRPEASLSPAEDGDGVMQRSLPIEHVLLFETPHVVSYKKTGGLLPVRRFASNDFVPDDQSLTISSAASKACCNATRSSPGLSWSRIFCSSFNCSSV